MTSRKSINKRLVWAPTSWSVYEVEEGYEYIEELASKTNTPLAAVLDGLQQAGVARNLSFVRIIDMKPMDGDDDEENEFFMEEGPN